MGVSVGRCAETVATAVAARAMLLKRIVRGWFELLNEFEEVKRVRAVARKRLENDVLLVLFLSRHQLLKFTHRALLTPNRNLHCLAPKLVPRICKPPFGPSADSILYRCGTE